MNKVQIDFLKLERWYFFMFVQVGFFLLDSLVK
jgi:hypothetical protein